MLALPRIGFGTGQIPEGEACIQAVLHALEAGYRLIDTADIYDNERSVGEAIRRSGIPRNELIITSKLHYQKRGEQHAQRELEASLARLGLDYLDLYLIHWPANAYRNPNDWQQINASTWRGMEANLRSGKAKAIGLCNFLPDQLQALLAGAQHSPLVNQLEFHPGYWQPEATAASQAAGLIVQAWSPLGCGELMRHSLITELAASYGKSPAQICLRWCQQHKTIPIVKSVTPERIAVNIQLEDFQLSERDMRRLDTLPTTAYSGMNPHCV